jgi:GTP-binding protein
VASIRRNILAIVGRPNVGKSALFNRVVGRPVSIVHEQAGVTRDRVSATARYRGKTFEVVDTGGIAFMDEEKTTDAIEVATRRQVEIAIEMAGALVMVADVTAGVTPLDVEIARKLRASGKPVFLAVNKVDNKSREAGVDEFAALGFEKIFPIAAVHGHGVDALLAEATKDFTTGEAVETNRPTRLAVVGRPNVGKSSLINAILKSDRTIVSELPGTTRDSVDVPFELGGKRYVLVDTAGLRHRRKIKTPVDQFGLMRAERSIRDCDVAVLVLDAAAGVTRQDKRVAGQIAEAARGCVVLVNKWDLAQRTPRKEYEAGLRRALYFLDWAPVLFVSARTGKGVEMLFAEIERIRSEMIKRVSTPELNRLLTRGMESYPPPVTHGRRFRIYYAFQKAAQPPTFVLFVNDAQGFSPHYRRFLIDRIRSAWGFAGCPVLLECRARTRRQLAKRQAKKAEIIGQR